MRHSLGYLVQAGSSKQSWAMIVGQFGKALPQGLKPVLILRNLMYGLKPVPFKLTHYLGNCMNMDRRR